MRRNKYPISSYRGPQRKKVSPLILTSILVPLVLALVATAVFILPRIQSHAAAAAANPNCSLIVPSNPLTAQGLATPYQLVATNANKGQCHETNALQAAFVQGAVFDPNSGKISIYSPLVIDKGTTPAIAPVTPTIPNGAVVALWFGFNGGTLRLVNSNGSLTAGKCVNGTNGSLFGQYSYCNAPAFFSAANQAIQAHTLTPPALGVGKDGLACPSVRDFSVVDMDQSDNVTTSYLIAANGQMAQMTAANATKLQNAQTLNNGSDNRLLAIALDGSLGCTPWTAPDLANPGTSVTALPLDELQAAAYQQGPVALVPLGDPMVLNNGNNDAAKVNAYRMGVDQPLLGNNDTGNTKTYCTNLRQFGPKRLLQDAAFTIANPTLDPATANSLLTFLEQRYVATYGPNGLNCQGLLKMPDPIKVKTNANGVAINGTINGVANNGNGGQTNNTPNCVVNGTTVANCTGTTQINGKTCTFAFDANTPQVNISCP
ncbi:MAG TPA: hypothetical protein VGN15_08540 [Ktedonobacteraceae bacterium]|nr:hypothetical protein [Ktedonobacteraceae bacterium]